MAVAMLLGVVFGLSPSVAAIASVGTGGSVVALPVADPSPSPTLGSTESPNPNPPGAQDADPSDYKGATWVVLAVALVVVLVLVGTLFWLRIRRVDHHLTIADADEDESGQRPSPSSRTAER
jgi:hypothetical protein